MNAMHAAELLEQIDARAQHQVIGVVEDDLADRAACSCSVVSDFTDASVPTGMNTGVSIVPCRVTISPRRAAPSVCEEFECEAADAALSTQHSLLQLHLLDAHAARELQREAALRHRRVDRRRVPSAVRPPPHARRGPRDCPARPGAAGADGGAVLAQEALDGGDDRGRLLGRGRGRDDLELRATIGHAPG